MGMNGFILPMTSFSSQKIFFPSHRKFRPATSYANYKIDHAMIVGDWS